MWKFARLNSIYHAMMERCFDKKNHAYHNYGLRGITVCDEWANKQRIGREKRGWVAFKNWALANGYRENLTIDRINNDKGYSPNNCRWVTYKVQSNNTRRNVKITYKGVTKNLNEWAETLGINRATLSDRIFVWKMPLEKAFTKNRLNGKSVFYKGKTQLVADWCKELNLNYANVLLRLRRGWSVERAFETKMPRGYK